MKSPTTRITTSTGYMASDCVSEEFSRRVIYITEEITDSLAAEICCQMNHLAAVSDEDITLWIMSPGGSVTAGFAILDTMNSVGCDIKTIVMGQAASLAAVIASSGTKGKRYIGQNAGMMIHQALADFSGQTTDILRRAQHIEEINNNLYTILAHNCGASIETIARDCDRDYHMDAKKAIDYGLVDHIYQNLI